MVYHGCYIEEEQSETRGCSPLLFSFALEYAIRWSKKIKRDWN
jgi:hypothetical protein